jgi:hypothetical protein
MPPHAIGHDEQAGFPRVAIAHAVFILLTASFSTHLKNRKLHLAFAPKRVPLARFSLGVRQYGVELQTDLFTHAQLGISAFTLATEFLLQAQKPIAGETTGSRDMHHSTTSIKLSE